MSENDPWKAVAARPIHDFIDCGDDETTLVFRMDDVKAARAAEATQHQQEVATLRAERDHQYTQAVEATQRALLAEQALANVEAERDREGAEHERTVDEFNGLADNMERLIAERDSLKTALQGLLELGRKDTSNPKYDGYYAEARAALTPQGQSTDGETK